jgi:hypothetical protein
MRDYVRRAYIQAVRLPDPERNGWGDQHTIGRKDGKPLLEEILSVSIVEISRGTAEVSGVTRDGINSRWGQARRDGACWSGEDFRICIE